MKLIEEWVVEAGFSPLTRGQSAELTVSSLFHRVIDDLLDRNQDVSVNEVIDAILKRSSSSERSAIKSIQQDRLREIVNDLIEEL